MQNLFTDLLERLGLGRRNVARRNAGPPGDRKLRKAQLTVSVGKVVTE